MNISSSLHGINYTSLLISHTINFLVSIKHNPINLSLLSHFLYLPIASEELSMAGRENVVDAFESCKRFKKILNNSFHCTD